MDILNSTADHFEDPKFGKLLANLQANILKPHQKEFSLFAFIAFPSGKREPAKEWLSDQAREDPLTSALAQLEDQKNNNPSKLEKIKCLYISFAGYRYLKTVIPGHIRGETPPAENEYGSGKKNIKNRSTHAF